MTETVRDFDVNFGSEFDDNEIEKKKKKKRAEELGHSTNAVTFIGSNGPVVVYELDGVIEYGEPDPDNAIWVEWGMMLRERALCLGADAVKYAMKAP
ncbi:MAG: hypothetical protein JWP06_934 [Candidatus Saccharibacteria bacterium]|nr:hypothetical protein [Candidatus Saccharibacteria bacterium]